MRFSTQPSKNEILKFPFLSLFLYKNSWRSALLAPFALGGPRLLRSRSSARACPARARQPPRAPFVLVGSAILSTEGLKLNPIPLLPSQRQARTDAPPPSPTAQQQSQAQAEMETSLPRPLTPATDTLQTYLASAGQRSSSLLL